MKRHDLLWKIRCASLAAFLALGCTPGSLGSAQPQDDERSAAGSDEDNADGSDNGGSSTIDNPPMGSSGGGGDDLTPVEPGGNNAAADASVGQPDAGTIVPPAPQGCDQAAPPTDALQMWLKAGTGITVQDGRVSSWADQSQHQDATQGDSNSRPRLENNALNSKPVVHFDQNDFLLRQLRVKGLSGLSIAIVTATPTLWKPGNEWCQGSGCSRLIGETGCSSSYQYVINWHGSGSNSGVSLSPKQEEIGYRLGVGGAELYSENSCKLSFDPIIAWRRPASIGKGYSSTLLMHDRQWSRIYVEGKKVQEITKRHPNLTTIADGTGDAVEIGGSKAWTPRSPDGNQVAEVLVYTKALSDDERKQLDTYLNCQFFPGR